jgi:hypothetical protein
VGLDTGEPPELRPHLVLKLKKGWAFDARRRQFVSATGKAVTTQQLIPQGAQVVHVTPSLAKADPKSLSAPERELARYVQLILPMGDDAAARVAAVRKWEPVAEVSLPPQARLP